MGSFYGAALATAHVTDKALTHLILLDKIPPFETCIAQFLKQKNILIDMSAASQKKLLFKRDIDPKYIWQTLDFIIELVDRHRRNINNPVLIGAAQLTNQTKGILIACERRKRELVSLVQHVKNDILDHAIPDVIRAVTVSLARGWRHPGGIPDIYLRQAKKYDPQALAKRVKALIAPPQTNTANTFNYNQPRGGGRGGGRRGRGRGGRGRGGGRGRAGRGRGRGAAQYSTYYNNNSGGIAPTTPKQLHTKKQAPTPLLSEPDPQLGTRIKFTKLKYVSGFCNNFQVWGRCVRYENDPTSCTFKHKCSNCGDQGHPRRQCPRDLPGEDRDA